MELGADAGYRWPAEWEPHAATWLAWPHNRETWPDHFAAVEAAFVAMVRALAGREAVRILLAAKREASVAAQLRAAQTGLADAVEFHPYRTGDAWIRDSGPIFTVRKDDAAPAGGGGAATPSAPRRPGRLVLDFRFDNWGRKYPDWERDAGIPARIAAWVGAPHRVCDLVLEGGAIDGDGVGSALTTESCLLHENRGDPVGVPRRREFLEGVLRATLGVQHVIWLAAGLAGGDTDGHVDEVARFVRPGVVVVPACGEPDGINYATLRENRRRLARAARDRGNPLEIVELPPPPELRHRGQPLPASYTNFYVANGAVLAPVFGVASDARALRVLAELFPDREVRAIPSAGLVAGLGAVHCLTQQEPRDPDDGPRRQTPGGTLHDAEKFG